MNIELDGNSLLSNDVVYNANGGTFTSNYGGGSTYTQSVEYNGSDTVIPTSALNPRSGYVLDSGVTWNTASDSSGDRFEPESSYYTTTEVPASGDFTTVSSNFNGTNSGNYHHPYKLNVYGKISGTTLSYAVTLSCAKDSGDCRWNNRSIAAGNIKIGTTPGGSDLVNTKLSNDYGKPANGSYYNWDIIGGKDGVNYYTVTVPSGISNIYVSANYDTTGALNSSYIGSASVSTTWTVGTTSSTVPRYDIAGGKTVYAIWKQTTSYSAITSFTYDGSEKTAVTGSNIIISGTNSATNAGSYTAYVLPADGYVWSDGTTEEKTVNWTISKIDGTLTIDPDFVELIKNSSTNPTATITASNTIGTITASSSNTDVATVSVSGNTITVTYVAPGKAEITVTDPGDTNHNQVVQTCSVACALATYTISYEQGPATTWTNPGSQTKTYGKSIKLKAKPSNLAKADGSGSDKKEATITLAYDANGGTGAPANNSGTAVSVSGTYPISYLPIGWSKSNNDLDGFTSYGFNSTYFENKDIVLYPAFQGTIEETSWTPTNASATLSSTVPTKANDDTEVTITVSYNANNGTGGPTSSSTGTAVNTTPYTFKQWRAGSTSGTAYASSSVYTESITDDKTVTMYAEWTTGETTRKSNPSITLSSDIPTRTGYKFLGWSESSTATSASYSANTAYTFDKDTTLYAVWGLDVATLALTLGTGIASISYSINGSSYTTVSSNTNVSVTIGQSVKAYATPSDGYYYAYNSTSNLGLNSTMTVSGLSYSPSATPIVTLPIQSGSLTYNTTSQSPSWNSNYDSNKMALSGTTNGINADSYTATFTPKSGYCWSDGTTTSKNATWSIDKYNLSNATIGTLSGGTYDGSEKTPIAQVTVPIPSGSSTKLDEDNYTWSYSNNINAGTATATITASSSSINYTGSKSATFSISKAESTTSLTQSSSTHYTSTTVDLSNYVSGANGTVTYTIASNGTTTASTISGSKVTLGAMSTTNDTDQTVKVTIKDAGDNNHNEKSLTYTLTVQKYKPTINWVNTNSSVAMGSTLSVEATATSDGGTVGTLTYSLNDTTYASISGSTVTGNKYSGSTTTTVTASLSRTSTVKAATKTRTFTVTDSTEPAGTISGGTEAKATSQTVTLTATDTNGSGVTKYYWGTSSTGTPDTNWDGTAITKTVSTIDVSTSATYYLRTQDASGNIGTTSIKFVAYTVDNLLETVGGTTDSYTSDNYESDSSIKYLIKGGTSLSLSSIYTNPHPTYCTFKGKSASYGTTAASLNTSNVNASNTTYYMWFTRDHVSTPVGTSISFTYDGTDKSPVITAPACDHSGTHYSVSGTKSAKNAGSYTVTYSLSSTTYQKWNDNTTSAKSITWTISKATPSATITLNSTKTFNGDSQTKVYANETHTANTDLYFGVSTTNNPDTANWGDYTCSDGFVVSNGYVFRPGTYYVWYKLTSNDSNYSDRGATYVGTFTLNKADVTISADSDSKVYDGSPLTKNSAIVTSGTLFNSGSTYTYTLGATGSQTTVGSSDNIPTKPGMSMNNGGIVLDIINFYNITYINGTLTVENATLTVTANNQTYTYNSNAQGAAITATSVNNQPVTIKYGSTSGSYTSTSAPQITNVSESPKTVYYQVMAPNHATKTGSYTITMNKADNGITVTATQSGSSAFSTSAQTKTITAATNANGTVSYSITSQPTGNYFSISGTTLTAKASTPKGSYPIVITASASGDENHNAGSKTITYTWTIGSQTIEKPTISNNSKTYNTQSQSPTLTGYDSSKMIQSGTTSAIDAGSYSVIYSIKDIANYVWSDGTSDDVVLTWTIAKYNLSNATIGSLSGGIYDGSPKEPIAQVTVPIPSSSSPTKLNEDEFSWSYSNNINAGTDTATATISAKSSSINYTGSKSVNFSIGNATMTVTAVPYESQYDGVAHNASVKVNVAGATVKSGTSSGTYGTTDSTNTTVNTAVALGATSRTEVGTTTVYYQVSKSNYNTVTGSTTIKINPRPITITGNSANKVYTGTALTSNDASLTSGSLANGQTATYSATGTQTEVGSSSNVPSVVIKSGTTDVTNNYTITKVNGTLTVTNASLKVNAPNQTFTYNGNPQGNAITATSVNNQTITIKYRTASTGDYNLTNAPQVTNATYTGSTVTPTTVYYQVSAPNHETVTGSYTITVNKAVNPISVDKTSLVIELGSTGIITASNSQGDVSATSSNGNATVSVNGNTITVSGKYVGTATITVTGAGNANYLSGSKTVSVTVQDTTKPNVSISGGTTPKVTSHTVTLTSSDIGNIDKYYWGTNNNPDDSAYTDVTDSSNFSVDKTVNTAGTYYFFAKDASGNINSTSITFVNYSVLNVVDKWTGDASIYNISNYESNGSKATYLIKSSTSITPDNIKASITGADYLGWSTLFGSSATALSTKNISVASNATYYMYNKRKVYTITFIDNSSNPNVTQTSTGTIKHSFNANEYKYLYEIDPYDRTYEDESVSESCKVTLINKYEGATSGVINGILPGFRYVGSATSNVLGTTVDYQTTQYRPNSNDTITLIYNSSTRNSWIKLPSVITLPAGTNTYSNGAGYIVPTSASDGNNTIEYSNIVVTLPNNGIININKDYPEVEGYITGIAPAFENVECKANTEWKKSTWISNENNGLLDINGLSGVITSIQVKTPDGWKFVSRDLWSDRNKEKYDSFPWE